ncbi:MAG: portal protein [bacterium]|nr:portal protein [bacterium]
MTQKKPSEIYKNSKAAWELKDQWKSVLTEAYSLALAGRNPYVENTNGPKPMDMQFDGTTPYAVVKLANRILMELLPPDQNCVSVAPGPLAELKLPKAQLDALKKHLESTSSMLAIVFSSGNFINTFWEMLIDYIIAGLGVMLSLEDQTNDVEPAMFQSVSQSEVAVEDDARGDVGAVYRKRKIKPRNIDTLWTDAKLPKELLDLAKKSEDKDIEVLEVTYNGRVGKAGAQKTVWYYEVLWAKEKTDPVRIVERVYDTNPWTVFRASKLPGSPYGPGYVLLALPDIRTANKIVEMMLKNAALALAGMYLVRDDGVLNPDNIYITPGGMIPVAATDGPLGASMVPLETGRPFNLAQALLELYQTNIKKMLFDNGLPEPSAGVRSPTEIIERVRELAQDLGGAIGRLTVEIVHLVRRVMDILARRGFVPPMKIDQMTLKVQVNSPLAKARQLQEVQTVVQWWTMMQQMGGLQAAMLSGKLEDIGAWMAERMGVPSELVRDATERLEYQKNMAQIASTQATAEMPAQAA